MKVSLRCLQNFNHGQISKWLSDLLGERDKAWPNNKLVFGTARTAWSWPTKIIWHSELLGQLGHGRILNWHLEWNDRSR